MIFAAKYFTPNELGFYYTLISLASFSLLFELGLSSVLATASAHQFIGLTWSCGGRLVGREPFKFINLARYAFKSYALAAFLSLLVIFPLGGWYISTAVLDSEVEWIGPWMFLMIATSISLLPTPMILIVEGTGGVAESYFVRLLQGVLGGGASIAVMYVGGGLYAAAMPALGAATVGCIWLLLNKRGFVNQIFSEVREEVFAGKDLLAVQWRAAISWLAGYALVLMYVPLLFKTKGSIASGQMALTMNVVNMTSVLAAAWMISRLPSMTTYIATQKWTDADALFKRSFLISIGLYVLGGFAIVVLRILLSYTEYNERVLSLVETTVLLIGMGFYHVSGLLASYLRAYLREPMVKVSTIGAVVMVILAVFIAPRWGSYGIVWLVFFVNVMFMFPTTAYLYIKLRREWQSE